MKSIISIASMVAVLILFTQCMSPSSQQKKTNIIFILADDLGYGELGCYGNTFNETPNLDQLANDGVRFRQAYVAAPVCSPYRAALMTGQIPAKTGITDYLRPDAAHFLDTAYTTLAEALQQNGYHTGIIGKWHLSGYKSKNAPIEVLPDQQGFNEVISSETTGIARGTYFHPYHFNPAMKKKLNTGKEFLVNRMNAEAIDFIERNNERPFFLYLSHYAVHTMLHGQPEMVDHFQKKPASGSSPPSDGNPGNNLYKKWPADYMAENNNPHLAAQLKAIDEGVGLIRRKLKALNIDENTILIFTSDNGGDSRVTDNAPLRGGKSMLYEGGIRVPLIAYQPGNISGGNTIDLPTANYDLYPTICEITGAAWPASQHLDGINLSPYLRGEKSANSTIKRTLYWHYPLEHRHFLGGRSASAIRSGDWKLIEFLDTGKKELYNLNGDQGEKHNIIKNYPDKEKELLEKLDEFRDTLPGK